MKRFTRFALRHVLSLVICLLSFGGLCFAQEPPEVAVGGRGSVFAPSGWLELIVPVQNRIVVKTLRLLHWQFQSTSHTT